MNYFFRNLHLKECQLDELWTFIHKKEAHLTALEKLAEVYGDAWASEATSDSGCGSPSARYTNWCLLG